MSEAPAAAINNGASVRASRADSEEAGVLSLLEDHNTHANNALSAASLTAALTAGTPVGVMHPEDIATMAMPQDLASHQARAVAALEQADTDHHLDHNRAHQHHQIVMPSMGALSQQQIQMDHGKQTFLLPPNMPHGSIGPSSHHLKDEGEIDNIPSITMPGSKPSTERLMPSSMSADFALTSSPHSICLCQAPTRIPRPRNG